MNPASNAKLAPESPTIEEQPAAGSPSLPDLPVVGIDWTAIREEYRTALISNMALAAKHGITEGAIRHRAKRYQWPRDLTAATQLATRDKLLRATRLATLTDAATQLPVDPATVQPDDPAYLDHNSQAYRNARSAYLRAEAQRNAPNALNSRGNDRNAYTPDPTSSATPPRSGEASEQAGRRPPPARSDPRTDDEIADEAAEVGTAVVLSHRRDIREQRQLVSLLLSQLSTIATSRESLSEMITANVPPTHYVKRLAMEKACSLPSHAAIMRDLTTAQRHLVVLERQAFNIGQETHGGSLEDWLDKLDPT